MSDYKNTLNLPKTEFPMKGNLPNKEPLIQEKWEKENLYSQLLDSNKDREKYILHDGPPYANGDIHIGHAVNKILKDVIVRSKILSGYNVPFVPGWDCHGLPIEIEVEKKIKKGEELSDKDFRKLCREYALNQVERQKKDFKRLGVLGDWENRYLTSNKKFEASTLKALEKIYNNGHLQKGFKPVHWCVKIQSALAEAEVEYQEKESIAIDVKFEVTSLDEVKRIFAINDMDKKVFVVIWTTTPWTLPSNKSIAVKSDLNYILVSNNKEIYIIAESLFEKFQERTNLELSILARCSGENLINLEANHPFLDNKINIISSDHVTDDSGTGCVHIAPAHGIEDFELGKKHNLEVVNPIQSDGIFSGLPEELNGTHVYKLDEQIINILSREDKLLSSNKFKHSYPHCWRTKTPLIYRATPQWFISMESHKLRSKALKAIDETTFYPKKGKERLKSMIETRPDWCVSRQRVWGVPLPIFVYKKDKKILVDDEVFENIAKIYEKEGSDCWFSDNPQKFLGKKYKAEDFEKLSDIVEVWFDSGSTHSFVLEKREDLKWPASMYLEGSDQHRGWFHSSLLESCGTRGKAPFESILSHGFVVDGKGLKMSKSLGNVIAPEDILKKYGADILRIWVASSNYAEDLRIDYSILDQHSESYRKIRNTFRYLLGNLNDKFEEINLEEIDPKQFPELEQFMLHKIYCLNLEFNKYFKDYDFHNLYKELLNFCTVDLSSFYFDIRKDTLYCDPKDSKKRKFSLIILNIILNSLLKWFAPILSFTTEEIYQLVSKKNKSIHLEKFLDYPKKFENFELNDKWIELLKIRDVCNLSIEQKRAEKIIGSSLEASLKINLDKKNLNLVKFVDLAELCITSSVEVVESNNDQIFVETTKANGEKCPVCWKINPNKCPRHD